jgi:hypothetical protein
MDFTDFAVMTGTLTSTNIQSYLLQSIGITSKLGNDLKRLRTAETVNYPPIQGV